MLGVGLGVGVGTASGVGAASCGAWVASVGVIFPGLLPEGTEVSFRPVETMTITARITAATRMRPKIICHLVLTLARS